MVHCTIILFCLLTSIWPGFRVRSHFAFRRLFKSDLFVLERPQITQLVKIHYAWNILKVRYPNFASWSFKPEMAGHRNDFGHEFVSDFETKPKSLSPKSLRTMPWLRTRAWAWPKTSIIDSDELQTPVFVNSIFSVANGWLTDCNVFNLLGNRQLMLKKLDFSLNFISRRGQLIWLFQRAKQDANSLVLIHVSKKMTVQNLYFLAFHRK